MKVPLETPRDAFTPRVLIDEEGGVQPTRDVDRRESRVILDAREAAIDLLTEVCALEVAASPDVNDSPQPEKEEEEEEEAPPMEHFFMGDSDDEQVTTQTATAVAARKTWEVAAWWKVHGPPPAKVVQYLEPYKYDAADAGSWKTAPNAENGPILRLNLRDHSEHAGHTWYYIECSLVLGQARDAPCAEWRVPRRLWHLRESLHKGVKEAMGSKRYAEEFGETPFAKKFAPRGTTGRLRTWLQTLAARINSGNLEPTVVALVLAFLKAIKPQLPLPSPQPLAGAADGADDIS
jgi:hypothetical protein